MCLGWILQDHRGQKMGAQEQAQQRHMPSKESCPGGLHPAWTLEG